MFKELPCAGAKKEIEEYIRQSVKDFSDEGIVPKLAVIRAGSDDGQAYYEGAILKQSSSYGIETQAIRFPDSVHQALFEATLTAINEDESVHGIIMLRPLPEGLDGERLRTMLNPAKDVDAITDISIAQLFAGRADAFYACTAEAWPRPMPFCSRVMQMEPPPMPIFTKSAPCSARKLKPSASTTLPAPIFTESP